MDLDFYVRNAIPPEIHWMGFHLICTVLLALVVYTSSFELLL